jgi:hypothetical protein
MQVLMPTQPINAHRSPRSYRYKRLNTGPNLYHYAAMPQPPLEPSSRQHMRYTTVAPESSQIVHNTKHSATQVRTTANRVVYIEIEQIHREVSASEDENRNRDRKREDKELLHRREASRHSRKGHHNSTGTEGIHTRSKTMLTPTSPNSLSSVPGLGFLLVQPGSACCNGTAQSQSTNMWYADSDAVGCAEHACKRVERYHVEEDAEEVFVREGRSDECPVAFRADVGPGESGVLEQGCLKFGVFGVVCVGPETVDSDVDADYGVDHSL